MRGCVIEEGCNRNCSALVQRFQTSLQSLTIIFSAKHPGVDPALKKSRIVISVEQWTSLPFNLREGLPFTYSSRSVFAISATEAFEIKIDERDGKSKSRLRPRLPHTQR